MAVKPEVILGDITTLDVDVIVNAANPAAGWWRSRRGHPPGGRSRAAGGLQAGAAAAGRMPSRACGNYYCRQSAGQRGDPHRGPGLARRRPHGGANPADAYKNSLQLASANNYRSIAFPAISTGVYGYPKEEAAAIAVRTVTAFLTRYNPLERVLFVCFDEETAAIYRRLLASYP